jgi:NitT/TauT family transport system permease protein
MADIEQLARLEAGLDALESDLTDAGPPWWRRALKTALPPTIAVLALLLAWDLVVWLRIKPSWVLPGPGDVWNALTQDWTTYQIGQAIWGSVSRALIGFSVALAIGTLLGLAVGRVSALRAAIGPILSGLQSMPSVAWVPIGIMWFGITPATIYMVVLLGAVPSIAIGLVDGLDRIPPLYSRVGHNLGARGLDSVRFILLPAALPGYVAGLKQGWAFAWRSLMAAELIAISPKLGPGVGQILELARGNTDMPLAFASILIILVIGIGINQVFFAPLERHLLRSRGLAKS